MIVRLVNHVRSNGIAFAALVLASLGLASGAYAALAVPANSVGALQLRNHSITPVKFDPRAIGGSVRHWADVNARGRPVSSSSRARDFGVPQDGDYVITWSDTFSNRCVALATPRGASALLQPASGFANTAIYGSHPTVVWVTTYSAQGTPKPMAFSLAVIC